MSSTQDILAHLAKLELEPPAAKTDRTPRATDIHFRMVPNLVTGEMDVVYELDAAAGSHLSSIVVPRDSILQDPAHDIETQFLDYRQWEEETRPAGADYWPRDLAQSVQKVQLAEMSPPRTVLVANIQSLVQAGLASEGFEEVELSLADVQSTSANSTSLQRRWNTSMKDFHRGNSKNFPFLPGGLDRGDEHSEGLISSDVNWDDFMSLRRRTDPPGGLPTVDFGRPTELAADADLLANQAGLINDSEAEPAAPAPLRPSVPLSTLDLIFAGQQEVIAVELPKPERKEAASVAEQKKAAEGEQSLDDILRLNENWLAGLAAPVNKEKEQWAFTEPIDVSTFYEDIPDMALTYPFELDGFQKQAILHLERGESVFVAAHTSAGKTVVAEYAIALSAKHMTRAIYTSPIKALSNQKFRDFKETFGDVGLITGDVSIQPEASCLIVTTEVLRSMLYKGADLIRDVEWVIFDEVHYINDAERGVVWEEVIIMLPDHVNYIFLSATAPNVEEFAEWIGRTKRKKVYVTKTFYRPVPLEHYIYTADDMFRIVDERGTFLTPGLKAAREALKAVQSKSKVPERKQIADRSSWSKLIKDLRGKGLLPVVVFAFSKKICEECAYGLPKIDLNEASEVRPTNAQKAQVHVFIEEALSRLKGTDRALPQVLSIKDLLKRGIGVHHGGLLPIIKEIVEILFSRGLVKVLFATETFAMGVNMPARTVVYASTRKHDGNNFRDLLPGEYTQMSGRAGRRGKDKVGTVILTAWNEVGEELELRRMILGTATKLESQFRLTFNMILNLLRVEDFRVEDMIKRSFSETETQRALPQKKALLEASAVQLAKMELITCRLGGPPDIEDYYLSTNAAARIRADIMQQIMRTGLGSSYLVPGRIVRYTDAAQGSRVAVLLRGVGDSARNAFFSEETGTKAKVFKALLLDGNSSVVTEVPVDTISGICRDKLKAEPDKILDRRDKAATESLQKQLRTFLAKNPVLPLLDFVKDMKVNTLDFFDSCQAMERHEARAAESKCHKCPHREEQWPLADRRQRLLYQIQRLDAALDNSSLHLMPEFERRLMVLQELNYIDASHTVLLKGRVAREVNTCESLIVTELIFESVLTRLQPEEICACLSTMLFEEKNASTPTLNERLTGVKKALNKIGRSLARVQMKHGLDITTQDFLSEHLNFGLMEVVYEWASGMPFSEICTLTNVLEGSIVRCITRLAEACKELMNCARIVGDIQLFKKAETAAGLLKRDVVFATSLYVV